MPIGQDNHGNYYDSIAGQIIAHAQWIGPSGEGRYGSGRKNKGKPLGEMTTQEIEKWVKEEKECQDTE